MGLHRHRSNRQVKFAAFSLGLFSLVSLPFPEHYRHNICQSPHIFHAIRSAALALLYHLHGPSSADSKYGNARQKIFERYNLKLLIRWECR